MSWTSSDTNHPKGGKWQPLFRDRARVCVLCPSHRQSEQFPFHSALLQFALSPFWLIQVFNVHISSLSPSLILELGDHITAVGLAYYIKNNNKEHKKDQVKRIAQ